MAIERRRKMIYCIVVDREFKEDEYIFHVELAHEPTNEEILHLILEEDINYEEKYHSFKIFPVTT